MGGEMNKIDEILNDIKSCKEGGGVMFAHAYIEDCEYLVCKMNEARKLAEELRDELHAHSATEAAYDLDTAEPRKPTLPWEEK
jgi:hypothetical protein